MRFTLDDNRIAEARRVDSPNHGERPPAVDIDLVVLHSISLPEGEYGNGRIDDFFCNRLDIGAHPEFAALEGLEVSAHLLIDRDGTLTQYVPFDRRAWHAGESSFAGRGNCNDYSIGIELEGTERGGFTDSQYAALAEVVRLLMDVWPGLTAERVVGHSEVSPGRKTDPGPGFDWRRFRRDLARAAAGDRLDGERGPAQ